MKTTITALLLFITLSCFGQYQDKYQNGLIITTTQDTIFCGVPASSIFEGQFYIQTDTIGIGTEKMMHVRDIKYLATAVHVYERIDYKRDGQPQQALMKILLEGNISLYEESYFNQGSKPRSLAGSYELRGNPHKRYILKKNGVNYYVDKKNYIAVISSLVDDVFEMGPKIGTKQYRYKNIKAMINEYNQSRQQIPVAGK